MSDFALFTQANYRLSVVAPKKSAQEDIFMKSAPGSQYEKVSRNNLDEKSFHYILDKAIQKLSEAEEALLANWCAIKEDKRFC